MLHVSLMWRNERMISMYVSLLPENHEQTHFFITKNIFYLFYNFIMKQPRQQLPNSSILLHSFASCVFGNDRWCTAPIGRMSEILKASNLHYNLIGPEKWGKWETSKEAGCYIWIHSWKDEMCVERDDKEQWKTFFISPTPFNFVQERVGNLVIYRPIQLTGGYHKRKRL
jgi:hypothetical protein